MLRLAAHHHRRLCTAAARAAPSFDALRVPTQIAARLARAGIVEPTPVQAKVLATLMPPRGASDIAIAEKKMPRATVIRWPTGSGKTLAYALPVLARLDPHARGVQAVVVVPTRELCLQTVKVFKLLTGGGKKNKKGNGVVVEAAMGSPNMYMLSKLKHHPPDVIVGTPATVGIMMRDRTLKLVPGKSLTPPATRTLVLDEVDSLVEKFRFEDVQHILSHEGASARTSLVLVSAHVPDAALHRCFGALQPWAEPADAVAAAGPLVLEPPERLPAPGQNTIRHVLLDLAAARAPPAPPADADDADADATAEAPPPRAAAVSGQGAGLHRLLTELVGPRKKEYKNLEKGGQRRPSALVFCESADEVEERFDELHRQDCEWRDGFDPRTSEGLGRLRVAMVHQHDGDRQRHRKGRGEALKGLADGSVQALLSTPMLGRGVDLKGLTHVVNLGPPGSAAEYLHRAGRVGRVGGPPGTVISLARDARDVARLRSYAQTLGFELESWEGSVSS